MKCRSYVTHEKVDDSNFACPLCGNRLPSVPNLNRTISTNRAQKFVAMFYEQAYEKMKKKAEKQGKPFGAEPPEQTSSAPETTSPAEDVDPFAEAMAAAEQENSEADSGSDATTDNDDVALEESKED